MRLRSGHIPLNSFAYLMGKVQSPDCSVCGKVEDVYHVIVECARNEAERYSYVIKYDSDLYSVGNCNIIMAFPMSEEAISLINLVRLALRRRK